jgi:hypothetical protein
MLKLTLQRERKSSTVRMRANRYNIDHNRPGMRQAPWRDRYVTRVLARPLQPRAPQLFSSRYCCAMSPDPVTSNASAKSVFRLYISSFSYHLSSVISSVICHLSLCHLPSIIRHLLVICHLPSATHAFMLHVLCFMLHVSCFMLLMLHVSCFSYLSFMLHVSWV